MRDTNTYGGVCLSLSICPHSVPQTHTSRGQFEYAQKTPFIGTTDGRARMGLHRAQITHADYAACMADTTVAGAHS